MLNQKGIILNPVMVWIVIILGSMIITQDAVKKGYITINLSGNGSLVQKIDVASTPSPSENPTPNPTYPPTPTLEKVEPAYIDPNPIITCTSSATNCSGQSIKVRQSECSKITCCQVGNKWSVYPSSDQCSRDQNATNQQTNTYPPCTVYYPSLKESKTYNYMSPENCSYWQERAKVTTQPLSLPEIKAAPLPTVEPYQYSQEYLDANAKAMKNITDPWKPTQVVLPTPRCYSTWEEYFKAHDMGNAPIYGTINSGPIPCD